MNGDGVRSQRSQASNRRGRNQSGRQGVDPTVAAAAAVAVAAVAGPLPADQIRFFDFYVPNLLSKLITYIFDI